MRHAWHDSDDARHALDAQAQARVAQHVAACETRHSGEIRTIVEASLPPSYLWRHVRDAVPMAALARQRALMQFSKAGVWDTAANNGVLIYLLLAEHRLELVADRGIDVPVGTARWKTITDTLVQRIAQGAIEQGLIEAVSAVSGLLEQHFPRAVDDTTDINELPDAPSLQ